MPAKTWTYNSTDPQSVDVTYDAVSAGTLRAEGFIAVSDANGIVYVSPHPYLDGTGTAYVGYGDGQPLWNLTNVGGGGVGWKVGGGKVR
jgi:hypothetical protein